MVCAKYKQLSHQEQDMLIAKLNHAVRNVDVCFALAERMVKIAEELGVYKDVKFGTAAVLAETEY